jgi:hypothetical protein
VRTWGCDKPTFKNMRCQGACLSFDLNVSGSFAQQAVIDCCEFEGWSTGAIINNGVVLAVRGCSFENFTGPQRGVVNLTTAYGYTAAVTAGSGTLTFSAAMTDVLIPNMSLLLLSDGAGNSDYAMVTGVAGTSVTVDVSSLRFTWSNGGASVTRLHGFGVVHLVGSFNTSLSDCVGAGSNNTPAYLYCAGQGMMTLANCSAQAGSYLDVRSIVVGNLMGAPYTYGQMTFANCSPLICADANHPLVFIDNFTDTHGSRLGSAPGYDRMPGPGQNQTERLTLRKWVFSPRVYGSATDNLSNLATIKSIAGDANTQQVYWGWLADAGSSYRIGFHDETFPSATAGFLRLRFRAKAASGTPSLAITALGNGGVAVGSVVLSTTLQTFDLTIPVPASWIGAKSTNTELTFSTVSTPFYFIDGILTDESMARNFDYLTNIVNGGGGYSKKRAGAGQFAKAVATTIFTVNTGGLYSGIRLKLISTIWGNGNEGYAHEVTEYFISLGNFFGTVTGTVAQVGVAQGTINAGTLTIDVVPTAVVTGAAVAIKITPTLGGANATLCNGAYVAWEAELVSFYDETIT